MMKYLNDVSQENNDSNRKARVFVIGKARTITSMIIRLRVKAMRRRRGRRHNNLLNAFFLFLVIVGTIEDSTQKKERRKYNTLYIQI